MNDTVIHDLKTPLTSLKVYVYLLKDRYKNEKRTQVYLQKMDEQINKLTALIDKLKSV